MIPVATSVVRHRGSLRDLSPADISSLLRRRSGSVDAAIRQAVTSIIDEVKRDGDAALARLASRFDRVEILNPRVPRDDVTVALQRIDPRVRGALERLARNLRRVHEAGRPSGWCVESEPGVMISRRPDPIARVGIYAPGGRAAYPTSLLMAAIPASVAGVSEIVVCSPPEASGLPDDNVLAAAALAGVDEVWSIGGAQAVAAMAFGTESLKAVDCIVGPGNSWVTEAKLQVNGIVGIDTPAGPSEVLVLAGPGADPCRVAAEMLAQCEHDPRACAVAVCLDEAVARAVEHELAARREDYEQSAAAALSLRDQGAILVADSLDEAIDFVAAYAPEHLLLALQNEKEILPRLRNCGSIILGDGASVVLTDYMTGGNHVLPAGGLARSYSGLSTSDFVRWTSVQEISAAAAARLAEDTVLLATAEGLHGHATAVRSVQW